MNSKWYEKSRRRILLDFHIDSWNEEFLTKYDPEVFAECVKRSEATAATFFANTHTGLTNYPTKVGTMHPNLKGRDILRETIDSLHRRGLDAIVYYCFIYVADYWNTHPEARVTDATGNARKLMTSYAFGPKRFATCCINDPGYRKFSFDQAAEICEGYDFEGVWPDMTFWPTICYCENCRKRYLKETGQEIPRVIDWKNPEFVKLIRTRQRWLLEYNQEITDLFKKLKPGVTVAHQSGTFTGDWLAGPSAELAETCDWMSADLYGERYGLSYTSKIFYTMSKNKPFERINCWNAPNVFEHVITHTKDEMRQIALSAIANDGALVVIDQVDPVGTVHVKNYEMLREVFGEIRQYEPYLGGHFRQDVGLYYSYNSNFDQTYNGKPVTDLGIIAELDDKYNPAFNTHKSCVDSAAKTLVMNHVPYGIVTKKNLKDLDLFKVLILANVAMLDEEEISAIRNYVRNGGALYASRDTSTISGEGFSDGNFILSDLFGVKCDGLTREVVTYISPTEAGAELYPEVFSRNFPLTVRDQQVKLSILNPDIEVLGTLTLPYDYPREDRHGSILTEPPGRYTELPTLVFNKYGKGRVIYSSGALELGRHDSQREVFYRIIKKLAAAPFCFETDAHRCVEITRFDQVENNRTMLHVFNYQNELPNLPVYHIGIKMKLDGKQAKNVLLLPEKKALVFTEESGFLAFTLEEIINYALISVEYE